MKTKLICHLITKVFTVMSKMKLEKVCTKTTINLIFKQEPIKS